MWLLLVGYNNIKNNEKSLVFVSVSASNGMEGAATAPGRVAAGEAAAKVPWVTDTATNPQAKARPAERGEGKWWAGNSLL